MQTPPTFNATILTPEVKPETPELTRQLATSDSDKPPELVDGFDLKRETKDRSEASDRLLILMSVSAFAAGFLLGVLISNPPPVIEVVP